MRKLLCRFLPVTNAHRDRDPNSPCRKGNSRVTTIAASGKRHLRHLKSSDSHPGPHAAISSTIKAESERFRFDNLNIAYQVFDHQIVIYSPCEVPNSLFIRLYYKTATFIYAVILEDSTLCPWPVVKGGHELELLYHVSFTSTKDW
jgi:hypothetical protein